MITFYNIYELTLTIESSVNSHMNFTHDLQFQIFRHCERTPAEGELYITSPYNNESVFAPYGFGQLTNVSSYLKFISNRYIQKSKFY